MKEHYKYNSLQLAYYKQTVNKNAVLRQTAPNIDKIYQQDLLKGRSLPFHKALCTQLSISRASANKHFVRSIKKIYQYRFHKVIILKHSTRVAMRTAFRRVPCDQSLLSAKTQQKCDVQVNCSKYWQNVSVRLSQSRCFKAFYEKSNDQLLSQSPLYLALYH